jgi:hypothetical protein
MNDKQVYLKPNVLAEPLFNQWYAWTYMVAPATAAMLTANLHLKIMQSFVSAPQVHIASLKTECSYNSSNPVVSFAALKVLLAQPQI